MDKKLKVRLDSSSATEEILSWKCCGLHNMNIELTVFNESNKPVLVSSQIELIAKEYKEKIPYLYPGGVQKIEARDLFSFYFFYNNFSSRKFIKVRLLINDQWFEAAINGKIEAMTLLKTEQNGRDET